ncbi:hypothetical protein [Oryza sativa Japonica Group]|uniref:Uncharacterized protein P0431G06.21 n=1 Tax=Oryza sativa subsp. japonica TaxID=39947 RepID=Q5JL03_ORYSJ|nr:hypothetical protein [Oryza sativa Japonica Group]
MATATATTTTRNSASLGHGHAIAVHPVPGSLCVALRRSPLHRLHAAAASLDSGDPPAALHLVSASLNPPRTKPHSGLGADEGFWQCGHLREQGLDAKHSMAFIRDKKAESMVARAW